MTLTYSLAVTTAVTQSLQKTKKQQIDNLMKYYFEIQQIL